MSAVVTGRRPRQPGDLNYYVQGRRVSYAMGEEWGELAFPTAKEALAWATERNEMEKTAPAKPGRLSRERQKEAYL